MSSEGAKMKWPVWALAGLWLGLGILGGCGESPKAEAAPKDAAVPGPTSKEGWLTSYSQAVSRAKAENKNILMDFTGSGWCPTCEVLQKKVFATPEFKKYA